MQSIGAMLESQQWCDRTTSEGQPDSVSLGVGGGLTPVEVSERLCLVCYLFQPSVRLLPYLLIPLTPLADSRSLYGGGIPGKEW